MKTDITEKGLESFIESALLTFGWLKAAPSACAGEYAVDLTHLPAFIVDVRPEAAQGLAWARDSPHAASSLLAQEDQRDELSEQSPEEDSR